MTTPIYLLSIFRIDEAVIIRKYLVRTWVKQPLLIFSVLHNAPVSGILPKETLLSVYILNLTNSSITAWGVFFKIGAFLKMLYKIQTPAKLVFTSLPVGF